jgi:hypothetical protein
VRLIPTAQTSRMNATKLALSLPFSVAKAPNKNGALIEMNHCLFLRRVEHAFALHFREFNAISRISNALKLSPPYLSHLS